MQNQINLLGPELMFELTLHTRSQGINYIGNITQNLMSMHVDASSKEVKSNPFIDFLKMLYYYFIVHL